jgi:hypothetical protein
MVNDSALDEEQEETVGFWADDGMTHYFLAGADNMTGSEAVTAALELLGDSLWQVYFEDEEGEREFLYDSGASS